MVISQLQGEPQHEVPQVADHSTRPQVVLLLLYLHQRVDEQPLDELQVDCLRLLLLGELQLDLRQLEDEQLPVHTDAQTDKHLAPPVLLQNKIVLLVEGLLVLECVPMDYKSAFPMLIARLSVVCVKKLV